VLACPFGVPKYEAVIDQMQKCDLCYDRTSAGKKPMCATVCPSQALAFTTLEEIERTRRASVARDWTFGGERVRTKVYVVVPHEVAEVSIRTLEPGPTPRPRQSAASVSYDVAELLEG
jgi:Fe-S-cluster-containing dehydrogenase component